MSTPAKKVQMHFEAALAVPEEKRGDYLAELCGREPELGRQVKALLDKEAKNKALDHTLNPDATSILPQHYQAGNKIGPYRIVEQIGVGGMGIIYKAHDNRLHRYVALKFLPPHMNADEQIRLRFLAEARAASRLDHPNICAVYDVGETPHGQQFITMPCYEGETLGKRIHRGALPQGEAIDIVLQIAEGLSCAHQQHIVHRDVKPSNIMLTRDGGVKVLDFGVAKEANTHLTGTGVNVGTLAYMSPEQLRGEAVDARADVWALGAVLYECLCGRKAFPGKSLPDILEQVLGEDCSPLDALAAQLPEPLYQVLQQALARELKHRFPDMASMLAALYEARDTLDDNHNSTGMRTRAPSKSGGRHSSYAWDEQVLRQVADMLLPILGPIAPVLVQRKAKGAADIYELRLRLSESLPDQASRDRFNKLMEIQVTALTSPPVPRALKTDGSFSGVELSPAQLASIEASLIGHLGPIAQTIIKRNAMKVSSTQELCDTLAQHLSNQEEKRKFIRKMHQLFHNE